jgi:MoxR-like ATPase
MTDWKIFRGSGGPHDDIVNLPPPPPWRFSRKTMPIARASQLDESEKLRAVPFIPTTEMIRAVNAALYLRRPLLLTGKPGSGKSTLISKVAYELNLGPVLRWPINSRSTVRGGIYEYDAVGRLQAGKDVDPPVEDYLKLGPLGTSLLADGRPRPLLVDEIDKSDLDFANDLLNVIEEGEFEIPELRRLRSESAVVRDSFGLPITINGGRIRSEHFPFVVMTSNAEREFPSPFLRRCIRLDVATPNREQLELIVASQLGAHANSLNSGEIDELINHFLDNTAQGDVSTDQLLNAIFLTVTMREGEGRTFSDEELKALRGALLRQIAGANA